jgi:hypothetical protein
VKRDHRHHALWTTGALIAALAATWSPARSQQQAPGAQNQTVESRGVRARVPAGWSFNQNLIAANGPVAFTNFGGTYVRGGILPPGGAEIEITSVALPPDLAAFVRKELTGTALEPLRSFSDSGKVGMQAAYSFDIAGGAIEKNVAIYIPRGRTLYKFYLSYWNGDRNETNLIATFGGVVREAQLR